MASKLKRILIVTPLYPPEVGGPATYSKLLHEELPKYGYIATVVNFGNVLHFPYIIRHIAFFFRCYKLAEGVEVVYAQDPLGTGLPAMLAAKLRGVDFYLKIVGDRAWETGQQKFGVKELLDTYSKKFFTNPILMIMKFAQKLVANSAKKVIVPSEYLKTIVGNWGVKKNKIHVVYNSFESIEVTGTKESLRKELKIKGKVIMSAGRLVPWKGFVTLIEIIEDLKDEYKDIVLIIAGDGPMKSELERLIDDKDLEDHVILAGRLDQGLLSKYIKASDLFLLNTGYEGLSHQLLEVMSIGTPIITTNVGGNPEIITDRKSGILVSYDNKDEIKMAVSELFKDKQMAVTLSETAKMKVSGFSKEKMLKELVKTLL